MDLKYSLLMFMDVIRRLGLKIVKNYNFLILKLNAIQKLINLKILKRTFLRGTGVTLRDMMRSSIN